MQGLNAPRPGLEITSALRQEGHGAAQEELEVGRQGRRHFLAPADDQERAVGSHLARRQGQRACGTMQTMESNLHGSGEVLHKVRQFRFAPEKLW